MLVECSANYGLAFNQPQKYEKDKKSVTEWFQTRLDDLKDKIKPSDYGKTGDLLRTGSRSPNRLTSPQPRAASPRNGGLAPATTA
jgi:hypothetical protein